MDRTAETFWLVDAYGGAFRLRPPHLYAFGRDQEANIEISDSMVSRRHCELTWDGCAWQARDLGSRNGTWLNGRRLVAPAALADRDGLRIGTQLFRIVALPPEADAATALAGAMREAEGTMDGAPATPPIQGELGPGGILTLLQFFATTRKSGRLDLDGEPARSVLLIEGAARAARCGDNFGEEALRALIADPGGPGFRFAEGPVAPPGEPIPGTPAAILARLTARGDETGQVDAGDLSRAHKLQARLLARLPSIPGYELAVLYEAHGAVGGDLYDIGAMADGRQLLVLGDVSGHGVQAALVVAMAVKSLRLLRNTARDPAELLVRLNDEILGDLLPGQFLTCFAAALDPSTGALEIVLAGHHPAWIVDATSAQPVGSCGMALGLVSSSMMQRSLKPVQVKLEPGAMLVQVTDGLLEAAPPGGEEYGEERMVERLRRDAAVRVPAQLTLNALAEDVRAYTGARLADDLTMIAVRRRPPV